MKQKLILLFFIFSTITFAQHLTYGTGGTVYDSEGKKVISTNVRILMRDNPEALKLYNTGRTKKTFGNAFFYGGLAMIGANVITAMNTTDINSTGSATNPQVSSDRSNMTFAVIGGILVAVSIPIKIGYPRKIREALGKYNNKLPESLVEQNTIQTAIIASNNQLGIRILF
ncbi:hypothetical protein [Flavobacterium chungbukense]|uniref:Uncharacterized protein n=1 Tax=Flavobacterium chungbukense TaxID=877464 RepID=A0ABP7YNT8_9FLAO|nr:hypothetical protein [Flavobacterium chungbukense]MCC4919824.1 hypothetical protein [Flavobacterium chungbukense]